MTTPDLSEMIARVRELDRISINAPSLGERIDAKRDLSTQAKPLADALSASLQREAGLRKALEVGKGYVERIVLDLGLSGERMHGTKMQTDLNQINEALAISTPPPIKPENTHDQP